MSVCKQETQYLIQNHRLDKSGAIAFSFTPSEYKALSWSEENKEFTFKGQRYDIIAMQFFTDEVIVKCYSDNNETSLVDAFSGFIKKMFTSPQHTDDNNTDIASNISKEYLPAESFSPVIFSSVLVSIKAKCVLVNVSAGIDDIWHPPTSA